MPRPRIGVYIYISLHIPTSMPRPLGVYIYHYISPPACPAHWVSIIIYPTSMPRPLGVYHYISPPACPPPTRCLCLSLCTPPAWPAHWVFICVTMPLTGCLYVSLYISSMPRPLGVTLYVSLYLSSMPRPLGVYTCHYTSLACPAHWVSICITIPL